MNHNCLTGCAVRQNSVLATFEAWPPKPPFLRNLGFRLWAYSTLIQFFWSLHGAVVVSIIQPLMAPVKSPGRKLMVPLQRALIQPLQYPV